MRGLVEVKIDSHFKILIENPQVLAMLATRKGTEDIDSEYESVKEIIIENTNSKDNKEERALEDNNNEEESSIHL